MSFHSSIPACDVALAYHPATLRWVSTAIDSILNQQNADCILHVIADAVPQEEDNRIRSYFSDAPNIFFYRNENVIGPYQSLHTVFKHFKTDYIAIQDSDDISLPHRIWHSVTALQEHNAEIFGGAMENFIDWRSLITESIDHYLLRHSVIEHSGMETSLNPVGTINHPTMVIKYSTFKNLNGYEKWFSYADWDLIERAVRFGIPIHASPTIVTLRRLHKDSLCQNKQTGLGSDYHKKKMAERAKRHENLSGQTMCHNKFGSLNKYL